MAYSSIAFYSSCFQSFQSALIADHEDIASKANNRSPNFSLKIFNFRFSSSFPFYYCENAYHGITTILDFKDFRFSYEAYSCIQLLPLAGFHRHRFDLRSPSFFLYVSVQAGHIFVNLHFLMHDKALLHQSCVPQTYENTLANDSSSSDILYRRHLVLSHTSSDTL